MLGDFFPESKKIEFAESILTSGHILRFHVSNTNPPKIKFLLIIGSDSDKLLIAYLYINTNINFNVHHSSKLVDLQYELVADDENRLDYNSFVDCSSIYEANREKLKGLIIEDMDKFRGKISKNDLDTIITKIRESDLIDKITKKKFGILK
ncbi:MAG: hypothetical protein U9N49_01755 [Campylobacterota bacterium]|nr:hypothetical protein [Campylobacterota bacterium]